MTASALTLDLASLDDRACVSVTGAHTAGRGEDMANKHNAQAEAHALGDVPSQLAALDAMSVGDLAAKYFELYGEPTRSRNKDYLRKRLAWRIQELAEGGLTPKTLSKIAELGDTLPEGWRKKLALVSAAVAPDVTPAAPLAPSTPRDPRLPEAGTVLRRKHGETTIEVTVLDDAFEFAGERFKSLSAIARKVTGTSWNGFLFFGLTKTSAPAASGSAE